MVSLSLEVVWKFRKIDWEMPYRLTLMLPISLHHGLGSTWSICHDRNCIMTWAGKSSMTQYYLVGYAFIKDSVLRSKRGK